MTEILESVTTVDKQSHRWKPGQSGNPSGRPKGARHAAILALDQVGSENAIAIMKSVVKAAIGGDMRACEILMRRLWPERRGRPVEFELPSMQAAADIVSALATVTEAVASAELSPEEGHSMAAILEVHRKAIETTELETRLAVMEAKLEASGR